MGGNGGAKITTCLLRVSKVKFSDGLLDNPSRRFSEFRYCSITLSNHPIPARGFNPKVLRFVLR